MHKCTEQYVVDIIRVEWPFFFERPSFSWIIHAAEVHSFFFGASKSLVRKIEHDIVRKELSSSFFFKQYEGLPFICIFQVFSQFFANQKIPVCCAEGKNFLKKQIA